MNNRIPLIENAGTIFSRVIVKIKVRSELPEFPFGLSRLDEITHGLSRERVSIIAARTSEGKTSFAAQTAFKLADAEHTVAYISLEDDREQIIEKLFCNVCEIDNSELKKGFNPLFESRKVTAERIFENLKLLTLDGFGYNFNEFKTLVQSVQPKPDVVFLDYIQMMDSAYKESRWDAISEYIRNLKKFSLEEKIATVVLSQVNRIGAEATRPGLHHLKQAGTLEEVADLVMILYYPFRYGDSSFDYDRKSGRGMEYAPHNYIEIQVKKNKTGRTGIVPVRFLGQHYRFEDWKEATYA